MAQADHVSNSIRALIIGAAPRRSTSLVFSAYADFVATLGKHCPRSIPTEPDSLDFEDRAEHLEQVLQALWTYFGEALDDTARNVPGGLALSHIEAVFADLTADVTGTIRHTADRLAGGLG
jgi:hypothetical protein